MNCEYGETRLDDYFDDQLNAVQQAALLAHCRRCAHCRAAVDEHTQYLLRLKQFKLSAPAPDARIDSAAYVANAAFGQDRIKMQGMWPMRIAAAVAVGAIGIGAYLGLRDERAEPKPGDIWSKVNIVIQVPADFNDAKLTVSLPRGVYVQGFDGMQSLAWNTDFVRGTNALELPVFVDSSAFDRSAPQYLDATLEYQGATKTFEFLVGIDADSNVAL